MTMPAPFLFVSHVSEDRAAAMEIVEELERRGMRCWIAPRDVRPGWAFDDEIANAIEASQAMLLIFSERCNDNDYIRREVTVAGESHKVVIPLRIENAEPKHGLRVRLSDLHWLDAFASRQDAMDELFRIFPAAKEEAVAAATGGPALGEPATPESAETGAEQAREGANAERRRRELETERRNANEQRVRAEAEARSRARPAGPHPPWSLLRTALAAVACLILIAIGVWTYPLISSYIKSKMQTTSAAQPTPGPLPPAPAPPAFSSAACKPQTASLYDDFHKPDAGWNFRSSDPIHYADGQLVVTPQPGMFFAPKYLSLRYQNVTICAHIKSPPQLKAVDGAIGGVVFWAVDNANFYVASIRPDGSYAISRRLAGTWINVVPRTKNEQIKLGSDAVNEVSVALVGNFGALFVNNVKVQEFRGQPPTGGAAVGLYAGAESAASDEWRFLDIAVMDNGKSKPVALPPAPSGPTIAECRPVNATDFQDTFTKPDPGWGLSDWATHYVDGQLLLKPDATRAWIQLYRALVFKNATVCVTVKSPSEVANLEDSAAGGLAFWASDVQNLYSAEIYPNGSFAVFRKVNNQWTAVVPRTVSDAIKKGIGAVNEMQVVLHNNSGSLYINGVQVGDFRGQPPEDGGATGLYAQSESHLQNEWRFLKFTVVENR